MKILGYVIGSIGMIGFFSTAIMAFINARVFYWQLFITSLPYMIGMVLFAIPVVVGFYLIERN